MVNAKRIRYGSEITSQHAARIRFNHDVLKECQILRRISRLRELYSVICGLKQDELHVLMRKVYFELF
jgi:PP-loop superfamily ATP-utilizing enzyme